MLVDVVFQSGSLCVYQCFEAVDPALQLTPISSSESRLLPFLVLANTLIASAPATCRLDSVWAKSSDGHKGIRGV
jgi:hypothetical protein